jgi:polysaccharide biosynthesis protein PslH
VANLLYLVHRLPFPPNKGDKVRSYHLLKHLASRHRVFLGTFLDDPADESHVEPLRSLCAELHVQRLDPRMGRLRSLVGLLRGQPFTLGYYRNEALAAWVAQTVREQNITTAVVFSSAMAQYVDNLPLRLLVDFVDVDSAKWTQYANSMAWPSSWLYRREGRRLLDFEAAIAARSARSFFVTDAEVQLFGRLAPECAPKVEAIGNGVDADYYSPEHDLASPYRDGEIPIVFTGAMDYWPNVDAVSWFSTDVLPRLRKSWPRLRFYIVGMRPSASVRALAGEHVTVTGMVDDVRPYLRHAAVVVAPLRVARGVQNKVLEAMAMARPIVVSTACAGGVAAATGREIETAVDVDQFVGRIDALLRDPARAAAMGRNAREQVLQHCGWGERLSRIDRYLEPPESSGSVRPDLSAGPFTPRPDDPGARAPAPQAGSWVTEP